MMRIVTRWLAINAPYSWLEFSTKFSDRDGVIGTEFFKQFSKEIKASFVSKAKSGLMDSMSSLDSDQFDHRKVDPLIRDFYENTYDYSMKVKIKWNLLIKPFGYLYRFLIANDSKQLLIPLNNKGLDQLDSWIDTIDDISTNRCPDYRCWIRINSVTKQPIYVGAYKTYTSLVDNVPISFVSVSFPILKGNLTTVLRPMNFKSGGLKLTTRKTKTSEAGVYLIFPKKTCFNMIPAFGLSEQFELIPNYSDPKSQCIAVKHTCYWIGIKAFEMQYTISKKVNQPENLVILTNDFN